MAIYKNYRKIYEQCVGPIPRDIEGRSFEIHHIDGDRNNNNISNLKCISLQDHYDIHFQQQDWGACSLLARKLNLSHETLSEIARKSCLKRYEEGRHPMQDPNNIKKAKDTQNNLVANGNHIFQTEDINAGRSKRAKKRQEYWKESNTHPFSNEEIKYENAKSAKIRQLNLMQEGKHRFQNKELQRANAIKNNTTRMQDGSHQTLQTKTCPFCDKTVNVPNYGRYHGNKCKLFVDL